MAETFTAIMDKGRVVIPEAVRRLLRLEDGDVLRFRTSESIVTIEKARGAEGDLFGTFTEWNSAEDDELYRNL